MARTTLNRTAIIAALSLPVLAVSPAYASGDQAALEMCRTALTTEAQTADVDFKSIRGASVRSVTFEVTADGESSDVVCKVKRGEIVSLDWNDTRFAEKS